MHQTFNTLEELQGFAEDCLRSSKIDEAQQCFKLILNQIPNDIYSRYQHARCHLLKHKIEALDWQACKTELMELLNYPGAKTNPENWAPVLQLCILCCEQTNDHNNQLSLALTLCRAEQSINLFISVGELLKKFSCYEDALYFFKKALKLAENDQNDTKKLREMISEIEDLKMEDNFEKLPKETLIDLALYYTSSGDIDRAIKRYEFIILQNPSDVRVRYLHAKTWLHDESIGLHEGIAKCRDLLVGLITDFPILEERALDYPEIFARLAESCAATGQHERAIKYYKLVTSIKNPAARHFYELFGLLIERGDLVEALEALKKSIELDNKYDTLTNNEIVTAINQKINSMQSIASKTLSGKVKRARYPATNDLQGDFSTLIKKYIAPDLLVTDNKFITKKTRFFTMGSCFARNISKVLTSKGFNSDHLEISEWINTTFSNKYFAKWLTSRESDEGKESDLEKRFRELLPENFTRAETLDLIRRADCFILTLGVAPAFFDRLSGEFIMPKISQLSVSSLNDSYEFRTTSVLENVENVEILIKTIRDVAPNIKIIVTVSPVPLGTTFEFESCVIADCISKSTMRITANEIVNNKGIKNIHYWPSFEIFRWVGSHDSGYFAGDDGSSLHVTESKVSLTIDSFLEIFSLEEIL